MKKLSIFLALFFAVLSIEAFSYTNISSMEILVKGKSARVYYATDFQNLEFISSNAADINATLYQFFQYLSQKIKVESLGKECMPSLEANLYFPGTNIAYLTADYKCPSKIENLTFSYDMFFEFFPAHQAHTTFNIGDSHYPVVFRGDYRNHQIAASEPAEKFGFAKALGAYMYALLILALIMLLGIFLRKISLIAVAFSIAIMIFALGYYGGSPDKLFPNECSFGGEFSCADHLLGVNEVRINLKNNVGTPIIVTAANLTKSDGANLECIPPALGAFKSGEAKEFVWILCKAPTGLTEGRKGKVFLSISYHASSSGPAFGRQSQGKIYSTVR